MGCIIWVWSGSKYKRIMLIEVENARGQTLSTLFSLLISRIQGSLKRAGKSLNNITLRTYLLAIAYVAIPIGQLMVLLPALFAGIPCFSNSTHAGIFTAVRVYSFKFSSVPKVALYKKYNSIRYCLVSQSFRWKLSGHFQKSVAWVFLFFLFQFLLILCGFHIRHPNPTYLHILSLLSTVLETAPPKHTKMSKKNQLWNFSCLQSCHLSCVQSQTRLPE